MFQLKKILSVFKIFLLVAVIIFPANALADDYQQISVTYLQNFVGDWYDSKGNLVFKIGDDYTINGYKVLDLYCDEVYWVFKAKISDDSQIRDITFYNHLCSPNPNINNYHDLIALEGYSKFLHRDKIPRHYESIGGIYLGMSQDDVLKLYGAPSEKGKIGEDYTRWKYNNDGFEVAFVDDDIVSSIKIFSYGNRKFDKTGLYARNSVNDFISSYNPQNVINGRNTTYIFIGYDELICVGNNGIEFCRLIPQEAYI